MRSRIRPALVCLLVVLAVEVRGQDVLYEFQGPVGSSLGNAVSSAGDVDNDGYEDIIVGGWFDSTNGTNAGMARVYSGQTGATLYTYFGDAADDFFGASVSGVGDVDQDGFADFVVGAPCAVFDFGLARVFSGQLGGVLYNFYGDTTPSEFGWSVGGGGDLNNDGVEDIVVGADHDNATAFESGMARVFSGANGNALATYYGLSTVYWFGWEVNMSGDVNNDGFADVISGEPLNKVNGIDSGAIQVISGLDSSILHSFYGTGPLDAMGWSAQGAGDVNGDGFYDIIGGAPFHSATGPETGLVRVYSGQSGSILHEVIGGDQYRYGQSVAGAGDLNDDGFDDVVIAAPGLITAPLGAAPFSFGAVDVRSGRTGARLTRISADPGSDSLFGAAVAGAGDVDGDGKVDLIIGAPGDDQLGSDSGAAIVYSGECFTSRTYGPTKAGTGGFVPELEVSGSLPELGNNEFGIGVNDGRGGAASVLFLGVGPASFGAFWGTLLVDVGLPTLQLPIVLGGAAGQPGAGALALPLPLPDSAGLDGLTVYFQVLIDDPGSAGLLSHTNGLEITLCQ